ncbi:MAG TPA: glycosyltransferase family 2 protein [Sulfurovum sp.]|nr:glycosyltransferase family 2 protein [Sulfurovum sp.]
MPRVSILTPSWNRADFLPKVHAALVAQTFQDFEWIVVDDGSEDDTQTVMQELMEKSTFPVTFASYSKRVGKCRADNTLLDLAKVEYVLWCDSDDILVPNAIEKMLSVWDGMTIQDKREYIAVISLCKDPGGEIQSIGSENFAPFSSSWSDLSKVHKMSGDMCIMVNRTIVRNTRSLEVDLVMSESGFWKQFMGRNVVCISEALKIMTRTTDNRISGSSKMEYCRGKAHAILLADKDEYFIMPLKGQVKTASKLIRYAIHGDLDIGTIKTDFGKASKKLSFRIGSILGYSLALKDRLKKRVYKSHIIFEEGLDAEVTIFRNQLALDTMKNR